jgi:hypothetical protein
LFRDLNPFSPPSPSPFLCCPKPVLLMVRTKRMRKVRDEKVIHRVIRACVY